MPEKRGLPPITVALPMPNGEPMTIDVSNGYVFAGIDIDGIGHFRYHLPAKTGDARIMLMAVLVKGFVEEADDPFLALAAISSQVVAELLGDNDNG